MMGKRNIEHFIFDRLTDITKELDCNWYQKLLSEGERGKEYRIWVTQQNNSLLSFKISLNNTRAVISLRSNPIGQLFSNVC